MLIVVVALVVSGCSAHRAPRHAGTPTPTDRHSAEQALVRDAGSLRDHWYLFRAEQVLDRRCMRRHGLPYRMADPGPRPTAGTVTPYSVGNRHHPTYGVTMRPDRPAEDRLVDGLDGHARRHYLRVLQGPDDATATLRLPSGASGSYQTGGCVAAARRALYGDVRHALEDTLVPQDVRTLLQRFLADYRPYRSALHVWRGCLADAGWHYDSPADAIAAMRRLAGTTSSRTALRRRQRAVAGADVSCDARSGLRDRATAGRARFLERQPPRLLRRLGSVRRARVRALSRAHRLLRGRSAPATVTLTAVP